MFCWHQYTKWAYVKTMSIYDEFGGKMPIRYEYIQKRECTKCGKVKLRKVKF